jgi:hypothetical protein
MRLLQLKKKEHRSISPEVDTRGRNDKSAALPTTNTFELESFWWKTVLLYEVYFNIKVTPYPCSPKNIYP